MDLLMFHRIKRYNDIKLKSKFEPKYKDDITLAELDQIYIFDIQGLNYKEISYKLKINLNKIKSILEMKNKINKINRINEINRIYKMSKNEPILEIEKDTKKNVKKVRWLN